MPLSEAAARRFDRVGADGSRIAIERALAEEVPIAIECNGIGYAVLMATPSDLLDLAYGFVLTERLADRGADVIDAEVHPSEQGQIVRVTLAPAVAGRVFDRVRHRTTDSSCGLCGVENLEQALRPLPVLPAVWSGADSAIFAALAALNAHQPLNHRTGAVHAAAACSREGAIQLVREDVGRHNAFDKLIGAMVRAGMAWHGGFALLTSRCSYELVEKAVLAGCPLLATLSAPTRLAVERAEAAGLALRSLVRPDALLRT